VLGTKDSGSGLLFVSFVRSARRVLVPRTIRVIATVCLLAAAADYGQCSTNEDQLRFCVLHDVHLLSVLTFTSFASGLEC
jgi:hypothetical protein